MENWEKSKEYSEKKEWLNSKVIKLLDKINTKISRITSRNINFYKELLWLDINTLNWKNILNVWAWNSKIDEELNKIWINPSLFVNTDLKSKKWVIADMRKLPFINDSFDDLLYLWSISWILYNNDKIKALEEALRVTKEWWNIFIYPVVISDENYENINQFTNIKINEVNLNIIFRNIGENSITKKICQYELLLVDSYYKYSKKIRWYKTVRIKIIKNENYIEEFEEFKKLIGLWKIII